MTDFKTLTELIELRRRELDFGITFIHKSDSEEFLSYQELYKNALSALGALQLKGLLPGNELVIQLDDLKSFIEIFWACILGGIIPVPIAVGRSHGHKRKLFNSWKLLKKPFLFTTDKILSSTERFAKEQNLEDEMVTIGDRAIPADYVSVSDAPGLIYDAKEDDIAFIQFSSGSTGRPKGVVLTHKNLLTNMCDISESGRYTKEDSMLSWMPLTHDMGLIGFHLNPLLVGMRQYLMPTFLFIRHPGLWLSKASQHKVSILSSPNFGYEYILSHFRPSEEIDLSCVRIMYNGAEPISIELCERFSEKFRTYHLSPNAICPVYGLAEASLAVAMSPLLQEPGFLKIKRSSLLIGEQIEVAEGESGNIRIVNVGKAVSHCQLIVTNKKGEALDEGRVGQIRIKGPNVTAGYYHNSEATNQVLSHDSWLNTGDLGFLKEGELYITGREKDILLVNGLNVYPHDLEQVAAEIPGVALNKIIVAGGYFEKYQREVSVAFVLFKDKIENFISLSAVLHAHINEQTGVVLDFILPVKEIPKTTSGKLQRFNIWQQFLDGKFDHDLEMLENLKPKDQEGEGLTSTPEESITRVWKRALKLDSIPEAQSFLQLGGNSIRAAEVSMTIWRELQVDLPISSLFDCEDLPSFISKFRMRQKTSVESIPPAPERSTYPIASAQKLIYFAWASDKDSIAYNLPIALKISGSLETEVLIAHLSHLVARYDVIRSSFELISGDPRFSIIEDFDFQVEVTPLNKGEDISTQLKAKIRHFDLSKPPLVHADIFLQRNKPSVLLLDFHHIIADGLSAQTFVNELYTLLKGEALQALQVRYQDFTSWEETQKIKNNREVESEFWKNHLGKDIPHLELSTDRPRPTVFDSKGGKVHRVFDDKTATLMRTFAVEHQMTLHHLLFSIYQVLLWKYTHQNQSVIGVPVSGRYHPDLENQFGMFVNNLAVRTELKTSDSFLSILDANRSLLSRVFEHQNIPFSEVVDLVGRSGDASRNLLFDTMFIYQNIVLPQGGPDDLNLSVLWFDPGYSKYDLSLEILESESELAYNFEFAEQLFGAQLIERMATYFEHLVHLLIKQPDQLLGDLKIKGNSGIVASEVISTKKAFKPSFTVDKAFRRIVKQDPSRTAVYSRASSLTYGELDSKSDRAALSLQAHGVTSGSVVAIMMDRSMGILVSYLAVLKVGAAFLPIDPQTPIERTKWILQDSHSELLIVDEDRIKLFSSIKGNDCPVIVDYGQLLEERPNDSLRSVAIKPDDLAYILYTSGSTGRPKGVMIEHRALMNYARWAGTVYMKTPDATFAFFTSIGFDLTLTSIFTPLLNGGNLKAFEDQVELKEIFSDPEINVFKLTPSHLHLIQKYQIVPKARSKVDTLIVGGESFDTQLAHQTSSTFGSEVAIFNEYGPTEATVGCMSYRFNPEDETPTVPIGLPIQNMEVQLLDDQLLPVAPGAVGQLYVSGTGLARGYQGNSQLTIESFFPHPDQDDKIMYKTGDRARLWNGNKLIYLSRSDDQIKVNGYRIELAEIELCLEEHLGVEKAIVSALEQSSSEAKILCAYYVRHPESETEGEALRNFLAIRLPHYMIPVHFIQLDEIPLSVNGKVDFGALPLPSETPEAPSEEQVLTEVEELLTRIWNEVLGSTTIRVTDRFFELGGDSIKAVQITSKCRESGYLLEVREILTYQTIKNISIYLKPLLAERYDQGLRQGSTKLWPIISWFEQQGFTYPAFYNQSVFLELSSAISRELAEQALKRTFDQFDELRLNLDLVNKEVFYNTDLTEDDLNIGFLEIKDDHELIAACEGLRGSLELGEGLLLKACVIHQEGRIDRLFITAHHLIVDGISWRILLGDFRKNCEDLLEGHPQRQSFKTAGILDWKGALDTYEERSDIKYWAEAGCIPFEIPLDYPTTDWRVKNRKKISWKFDKLQTEFLLTKAHQAYGTEVPHLLNTALVLVLKCWTDTDQFVIEHENHGRHLDIDMSRTLGWYTAMYPVSIELTKETLSEQIMSVKEQLRDVPDYGLGYPVDQKKVDENIIEGISRSQVRFNYLGDMGQDFNNDHFKFCQEYTGDEIHPENEMTTVLEWNCMVLNGCFNMELLYNAKAYRYTSVKSLSDQFFYELSRILSHLKDENDVHFTPSDFQAADLNQEELDILFG